MPPPAWAFNDVACAPGLLTGKRDKNNRAARFESSGFKIRPSANCLAPATSSSSAAVRTPAFRPASAISCAASSPHHDHGPDSTRDDTHGRLGSDPRRGYDGLDGDGAARMRRHPVRRLPRAFVAPTIPTRPLPGSTPQYDNMGHIVTGVEGIHTAGAGNVMTLDRGSNSGVVLGQRYLVFRDKRDKKMDVTGRSKVFADMARNSPSLKSAKYWSSPCGLTMRPCRSWRRETRSRTAISIAPIR